MEQTKKKIMYAQIEKHGQQLNDIFHTEYDNISLCKKLHRLERKAHVLATDYCNGAIEGIAYDDKCHIIMDKLCKILGENHDLLIPDICFVNGDCRGYALKIHDDIVRDENLAIYRDWGGYGILAPDFS